jgi:DNA modification methylase
MIKSRDKNMEPVWSKKGMRIYHGDWLKVLKKLPEKSVHCVTTSPPYWGLRDYGNDKSLELGCEKTPKEYVERMVQGFQQIYRVLRDDGCVWLNLGDTYNGGSPGGVSKIQNSNKGSFGAKRNKITLKSGNLVGIPWMVAFALQADGWILRQDIIWNKPAPTPEPVRSRCTKAHEYIFLLTKSMKYFFDPEPIREAVVPGFSGRARFPPHGDHVKAEGHKAHREQYYAEVCGANKRDVWTVASQGYADAHFATYPMKLIEPCILAGTSEKGCCPECGKPWIRITEKTKLKRKRPREFVKRTGQAGTGNKCNNTVAGTSSKTIGWQPTCDCNAGDPVPCTVLDPFLGSGTTLLVASKHFRYGVGIELSEEYIELAKKRIGSEINRPNFFRPEPEKKPQRRPRVRLF